ncbi:MAG: DUF58 domain-containing protein [Chitinophagales bacterium]|nr:DUF58 domain-containing protein [Chitinophagales bacterium]
MNRAELLKKVRRIEIKSRSISDHLFSGEYHTAFKGRGMSFSEVREYHPGDDIKFIDWNVTARFGTPYVKLFEEERELTVMLLVDISRSAFFGTVGQLKNELIAEICAVLAFSATHNNDKVGVIFFHQNIEKFIPPKKGRSHVLRIIHELLEYAYGAPDNPQPPTAATPSAKLPSNKHDLPNTQGKTITWREQLQHFFAAPPPPTAQYTDLNAALQYFGNVIKRRCIAFVLSDFMSNDYEKSLDLAARKHDIIGIRIYDPHEKNLPNIGLLPVVDAETQAIAWLDTTDDLAAQAYRNAFRQQSEKCKNAFARCGADLLQLSTEQAYIPILTALFRKRK